MLRPPRTYALPVILPSAPGDPPLKDWITVNVREVVFLTTHNGFTLHNFGKSSSQFWQDFTTSNEKLSPDRVQIESIFPFVGMSPTRRRVFNNLVFESIDNVCF